MTTALHSTLKRALIIEGREYVVTLSAEMLRLTLKGRRKGFELPWANLVNGEAALAVALHASIGAFAGGRDDETALPAAKRAHLGRSRGLRGKGRAAEAARKPPGGRRTMKALRTK